MKNVKVTKLSMVSMKHTIVLVSGLYGECIGQAHSNIVSVGLMGQPCYTTQGRAYQDAPILTAMLRNTDVKKLPAVKENSLLIETIPYADKAAMQVKVILYLVKLNDRQSRLQIVVNNSKVCDFNVEYEWGTDIRNVFKQAVTALNKS